MTVLEDKKPREIANVSPLGNRTSLSWLLPLFFFSALISTQGYGVICKQGSLLFVCLSLQNVSPTRIGTQSCLALRSPVCHLHGADKHPVRITQLDEHSIIYVFQKSLTLKPSKERTALNNGARPEGTNSSVSFSHDFPEILVLTHLSSGLFEELSKVLVKRLTLFLRKKEERGKGKDHGSSLDLEYLQGLVPSLVPLRGRRRLKVGSRERSPGHWVHILKRCFSFPPSHEVTGFTFHVFPDTVLCHMDKSDS